MNLLKSHRHNNPESQRQYDMNLRHFSTQTERVAFLMWKGDGLTTAQAMRLGILDLRARVRDIRHKLKVKVCHENIKGSTARRWFLDDEGREKVNEIYKFG